MPRNSKRRIKRFFDQVVRTRCAGSDADDSGSVRQPEMRNHFAFLVQIVMLDLRGGNQPRSVEHKIGGQFFFAHLRQVRRVRAVVTAHDQQQIHWHVEQFAQRILPLLSGAADRVEETKIFRLQAQVRLDREWPGESRRCTSSVSPRSIVV